MSINKVAEFFATVGFQLDPKSLKEVDAKLNNLRRRLKRFADEKVIKSVKINRFEINEKALLGRAKTAVRMLQKDLKLQMGLNQFEVDKERLLREVKEAIRYVERHVKINLQSGVVHPRIGQSLSTGADRVRGGMRGFSHGLGIGSAAGGLGRGFIPGLGVAFGVSQVNRVNQELIGQKLAATAIFGNEEAGAEQVKWLKNLGNTIGFDYRSQGSAYMKMQAAATTAGMSINQGQQIFKSMAEYGRVMGLNDEDMKGSMRAVEQMLN